ncbi:hypothetical protein Cadr_000010646, partial [Camelus dromedarius]
PGRVFCPALQPGNIPVKTLKTAWEPLACRREGLLSSITFGPFPAGWCGGKPGDTSHSLVLPVTAQSTSNRVKGKLETEDARSRFWNRICGCEFSLVENWVSHWKMAYEHPAIRFSCESGPTREHPATRTRHGWPVSASLSPDALLGPWTSQPQGPEPPEMRGFARQQMAATSVGTELFTCSPGADTGSQEGRSDGGLDRPVSEETRVTTISSEVHFTDQLGKEPEETLGLWVWGAGLPECLSKPSFLSVQGGGGELFQVWKHLQAVGSGFQQGRGPELTVCALPTVPRGQRGPGKHSPRQARTQGLGLAPVKCPDHRVVMRAVEAKSEEKSSVENAHGLVQFRLQDRQAPPTTKAISLLPSPPHQNQNSVHTPPTFDATQAGEVKQLGQMCEGLLQHQGCKVGTLGVSASLAGPGAQRSQMGLSGAWSGRARRLRSLAEGSDPDD